jgi:RNA polymerase sigma-70 factor (ECF subfamily)
MPEPQRGELALPDDRNLVERVCAGDRDAAELLFGVRLRRRIRYLAMHCSYEDLFGELYLYLMEDDWRRLRTWRAESSLDSWLQTVAINLCIQRLKKERRLVLFDPEIMAEKWGVELDPDKALLRSDLLRAIESLSSAQERLLIMLHSIQDKPIEEVAKILHINVNNAYQIKRRAIQHLREKLTEKGEGADA